MGRKNREGKRREGKGGCSRKDTIKAAHSDKGKSVKKLSELICVRLHSLRFEVPLESSR